MGAASIRYAVEPRTVPAAKAARRLHLTADEFRNNLPALWQEGFPRPCPVTGHYDLVAIDAWLDRRAGFASAKVSADNTALMRGRIEGIG